MEISNQIIQKKYTKNLQQVVVSVFLRIALNFLHCDSERIQ